MDDEAKEDPYRPYGPVQECDVLSTPRWQFALWGMRSIAYGVLSTLFKVILWWLVLLFAVPAWVLFRHVPDWLMELGRSHRGVDLLELQIPKVICGLKYLDRNPPSVGDWIGSSVAIWGITAMVGGVISLVVAAKGGS